MRHLSRCGSICAPRRSLGCRHPTRSARRSNSTPTRPLASSGGVVASGGQAGLHWSLTANASGTRRFLLSSAGDPGRAAAPQSLNSRARPSMAKMDPGMPSASPSHHTPNLPRPWMPLASIGDEVRAGAALDRPKSALRQRARAGRGEPAGDCVEDCPRCGLAGDVVPFAALATEDGGEGEET